MNVDPRTLAQTLKNKTDSQLSGASRPGSHGTCLNKKAIGGEVGLGSRGSQVPDVDSAMPDVSSSVSLHFTGQHTGFQLRQSE